MKVLDSDLLVAILRGKNEALAFVDGFSEGDAVTTSINSFELFRGAFKSENADANLQKTSELLSSMGVLVLDGQSSRIAGEIYARLEKSGSPLEIQDCLVAAITISNNAVLVTRNHKHFSRVSGLKIEKW